MARPVLLRSDSRALSCTKYNLAIECLGKDLVEVTLVTGHAGAIGQGDSDRKHFRGRTRRRDEAGTEIDAAIFTGSWRSAPSCRSCQRGRMHDPRAGHVP
jgi:hypothetical protein